MKLSKLKLSVLFSIVAVLAVFVCVQMVRADAGSDLYGYTWSSNIGWIKLNDCDDPSSAGTCNTTASYGVNALPSAPGTMSGYAWSSNIGWITFNPSGCPTTGCTPGAYVDWAHPNSDKSVNIIGWARACSVYASGCSGPLKDSASLGQCNGTSDYNNQDTFDTGDADPQCEWDGYIALDSATAGGTAGTWGLEINGSKNITGYAWGSQVMGWIHSITGAIYLGGPTVQLVANPATIVNGASSVLTVTATNIDGPNSCSFANLATGLTMTQGSGGSWTGTISVSPSKTTPYTVNCTKGIQTATASATVTVIYFVTPTGPGGTGGGSGSGGGNGPYCANTYPQFAWDSDATSCTLSEQGGGTITGLAGSSQAQGGTLASDGLYYYLPLTLPVKGASSVYTLQCTGGSQPVNIQQTVNNCEKDFIVVPSPTAQNMTLTGDAKTGTYTGTFTVSIVPQSGFTDPVALSIPALPSGAPASLLGTFSPSTLSMGTGGTYGTSQLTFTVPASDVTIGAVFQDIVIDGISGNLTRTAKVTLTVGGTTTVQPIYKEF